MPLVIDAPSAVAASKCLAARLWPPTLERLADRDSFHPRPCLWEDWTKDALVDLLARFNEQAGYDDRTGHYADIDIQRYRALPRSEQARLVREAQYGADIDRGGHR